MFSIPRPIKKLIESFEKLPGVGPKTAQRLTFYLLHVPQEQLEGFALALSGLKKGTVLCSICYNVAENNPCPLCQEAGRNSQIICVVEQPLDLFAIEKTGRYKGLYHVLHGAISPINNIGPEEIYVDQLFGRINESVSEIILAMNPTMEGEATAMYVANKIGEMKGKNEKLKDIKITRIGQGLPIGGDLEYADDVTLTRAMEGRREF